MKKNKNWYYMHTINGRPAQYIQDEQICYAHYHGVTKMADSLQQIYKEQKATIKWREAQGFESSRHEYGYVKIARKLIK